MMQHHSHPGRPQHINHHVHPQMHPGHPPPPMGVGQQIGPPPIPQQQAPQHPPPQHHLPNVPPPSHGGPQSKMYIPPQQQQRESHRHPQKRFGHHLQQQQQHPQSQQPRMNSQIHQNQMHPKGRPPTINHGNSQMAPQHMQSKPPNIHPSNNSLQPPNQVQSSKHHGAVSSSTHPTQQHVHAPPHNRHQSNQYQQPIIVHYSQTQQAHAIPNHHPVVATTPQPTAILQNTERLQNQQNGTSNNVSSTTNANSAINLQSKPKLPVAPRFKSPAENQTTPDLETNGVQEKNILNSILDPVDHGLGTSSKEKTPMCLVNELARYNKIQHQYRLTGEQGPAHCKRFTVTLKLGDEEYTAEGPSIKKAQHTAAADAVSKTLYEHPPPKTIRLKNGGRAGIGNITPTVELNALAMKMGQPTVYVFDQGNPVAPIVGGHHIHNQHNFIPHGHNNYGPEGQYGHGFQRNNMYGNGRYQVAGRKPFVRGFSQQRGMPFNAMAGIGPKEICKITLMVGKQKFVGIGPNVQAAKHDAATRALEVLKPIVTSTSEASNSLNTSLDDPNSDLKSPISLVHEMALKRNLSVTFEVLKEMGPPHMRTFITLCKVGSLTTEGEGNGKKVSKKRAAEKMMEELKKLPPLSPSKVLPVSNNKLKNFKRKQPIVKKKTRNLIKENPELESPEEVNPISKLIQIQQALKEKEPVYRVIEEKGAPRRREFVIEVEANGHTASGYGTNKKRAKKSAAKNLLVLMGYEETTSNPDKENEQKTANIAEPKVEKSNSARLTEPFTNAVDKNSTSSEATTVQPAVIQGGTAGRQIVPGMLIVPTQKNTAITSSTVTNTKAAEESSTELKESPKKAGEKCSEKPSCEGVRPKDQLMYLAQLLGFQAEFSNYPKGNHGEYLTIVTLSTDPPQICHGAGADPEASEDIAASTALKILSEIGLDNVKPKKPHQKEDKALVAENSKE